VRAAWPVVRVANVDSSGIPQQAQAGDVLEIQASVALDGLSPDDVAVEVVFGPVDGDDDLGDNRRTARLQPAGPAGVDGLTLFTGSRTLTATGSFGYTVRVVPAHPQLVSDVELGLIAFAS